MRRVFILLIAACGVELGAPPEVDDRDHDGKSDEDHEDDHGGGGMPLTASKFLSEIGEEYCDECFRCRDNYPDGTSSFEDDFGATKQACYADLDAYYAPALVEQSITAGRVLFDASAAKDCLDGIRYESQCSRFWDDEPYFPQTCDVALVGTIPDGGACVSPFDCVNLASSCDAMTKQCTLLP